MPTDHRERLARIRRFDQLVAYLRDELGWPIDSDDFEELTFEYTPEELGIDAKNAATIQEIKRLRPLVPGPALGHLLRQVRAEAPTRGGAAPHPWPGGAQEARLGQHVRAPSLGRRRPALRLQLRRGRGAPHRLRALLEAPGRPRPAHAQGARLGQPRHAAPPRRRRPRVDRPPHLARRRGTIPRPGASAGAPPSGCATARSSPPRSSSPSASPNWPARSATASGRRWPSRPRPARSPSS